MTKPRVIVIGGGHAGCEAALLCSCRLPTVLVSLAAKRIAQLSCNPAIGGVAKGHLVREVDALGGVMGRLADQAAIQVRTLNTRKGPAVQATRAQVDAHRYPLLMQRRLAQAGSAGLTIVEDEALALELRRGRIAAVRLAHHGRVEAEAVVLCSGTFLGGLCHIGPERFNAGRWGDPASQALSRNLGELGLSLLRFKTGTTPRLLTTSLDLQPLEAQDGLSPAPAFSFWPPGERLPQVRCYLTSTSPRTNEIIRSNIERSPLYGGVIAGTGPRYCPSIEDKVVKFPEREAHTVFLEPEGLRSLRIYPNGLSTSLPLDVQLAYLHSIPGLQAAVLVRPGYAVEYDVVRPTQLNRSLMVKAIPGLFLAGQINGTSGYEEAAAQGVWAGINASRYCEGRELAELGRQQAYTGVMIDDLVTRGTEEPYRMFTSRSELRLLLREDNADLRLTALGRELGTVDEQRWDLYCQRRARIEQAATALDHCTVQPGAGINEHLVAHGSTLLREACTARDLLRRPELTYQGLQLALAALSGTSLLPPLPELDAQTLERDIKYQGYIERQQAEAARLSSLDEQRLPSGLDYEVIPGLTRELREKLGQIRPSSLGQAGRIPGMTPAGMAVLRVWLARGRST